MKDRPEPTFIMVPRKLIIAWLMSSSIIFALVIGAYQYANYVDRKSNQRWCGIVVMYDDNFRLIPPPSELGRRLASEFREMRKDFRCK